MSIFPASIDSDRIEITQQEISDDLFYPAGRAAQQRDVASRHRRRPMRARAARGLRRSASAVRRVGARG